MSTHTHPILSDTLESRLRAAEAISLAQCYQCGKCAAGCPVAEDMDIPPSQVLRLMQRESASLDQKVLASEAIWLCVACETCVSRCPQEVDIPKIMDFLRSEALARGTAHPRSKDILAFHRAFLDSVKQTGRLYEVGLVADYKLRSRHFLKDVMLAPKMLSRGKLPLLPHMVKDREAMKRIFHRTLRKKG